jgi:hypothetical protein
MCEAVASMSGAVAGSALPGRRHIKSYLPQIIENTLFFYIFCINLLKTLGF